MELLSPDTAPVIVVMSTALDVTAGATSPTGAKDSALATASEGALSTQVATPATDEISIGAARTWQPRLRETTVIVKNFMLTVDYEY